MTEYTYGRRFAVALDQLCNTLCGGWPDETLSARAYRLDTEGVAWPRRVINALFFWQKDHCKSAYQNEVERLQMPASYRKGA